MKNIFKYFGVLLTVALMGAVTACNPTEIEESADLGLGIKVFFPTKVVAGQPMTINGSGFSGVREVVFPDGITVSSFEIVSDDMIRVTAPSGISSAGGKLIVRTADEQAESRLPLTLGRTTISGYSLQDGESISSGDQLTIYGQDLEFINGVELLDSDGNPYILKEEDFYRKGTNTLIFTIPRNIFDGNFIGKLYTYDGREFALPDLTYAPPSDGGHWETVKTDIWKGDAGAVSWNGTYRFALEGHDGNNECIAEIPQDIWDKMMTETFYMDIQATDPQVRVTTGWWDPSWNVGDIQPGNEHIVDNGDGTWTVEINLSGDPDFVAALVDRHILFTGDRYTPIEIYFQEEVWVDGGDSGPKEIDIAPFTFYEDRSATLEYPYFPSWGDNSGKLRIMRGVGDPSLEALGLTTSSKFIVYKEVGTTGQIQWNNPNWTDFQAGCNDWDGSAETIEVPITEDMLKWINGEATDGWSDTAIILQGDGLKVTKIVIVP